jgi:hypothetical protein
VLSHPIPVFPTRFFPPQIGIFHSPLFFTSAEIAPPLPSSEEGRCLEHFDNLSEWKCENQEFCAQLRSGWTNYAPCARDKEINSRMPATWAQKYESLWEISSVADRHDRGETIPPPPPTTPSALGYPNYVSCFDQDKGPNGKAGVPKQETGNPDRHQQQIFHLFFRLDFISE